MSDKPSYLGLLNAISVAESNAHCYLSAWLEVTDDPDVKATLATVAAREGEHGMAFAKRINELGYSVRVKEDPSAEKALAIAGSCELTDLEKMRKLGLGRLGDDTTFFDGIFTDHSIDIQTGALLGRYICEEHDTARMLKCCHEALEARATTDKGQDADLAAQVAALCQTVEELRELVTKASRNGKEPARAGRR